MRAIPFLVAFSVVSPAFAADLSVVPGADGGYGVGAPPAVAFRPAGRCVTHTRPYYIDPRIPTNAPSDPTYVGSWMGLSKPSYYGNTPPLGQFDPYIRRSATCY